jgi:glycosyltransferase involved in cell wall biosynthesis
MSAVREAPLTPGHEEASATTPSVSVVIPTHQRPELVRRAIRSVLDQEYDGWMEVVVVFDRAEPDRSLERLDDERPVRVMANERTPGLAGSRNTGILASSGRLVAFCDDDDMWLPGKLVTQVDALQATPGAEFVTTAMTVDYQGKRTTRLAGRDRVDHTALLRSRMAMLHSSSFLIRRTALLDHIGLVEEGLPRSMAEDRDLLLRASRRQPILHVDLPLIEVTWGGTSYFIEQWAVRNEAQLWLLEHHPDLTQDRTAAGLIYGKLAFGTAALSHRRSSVRWASRAVRANWREPRAYLALLVASGVVRWTFVVRQLNRRGHGI